MYLKKSYVSEIRRRKSPLTSGEINELGSFTGNRIISYDENF